MWLMKTEPETYSWGDLVSDKKTMWDGVTNALALKHIRAMRKGDQLLIYHTGKERAIVGVAEVASQPQADPKDERLAVVEIKPRQALAQPVTLTQMKADSAFAGWELLRIGRLSVMPVPQAIWTRIQQMAGHK